MVGTVMTGCGGKPLFQVVVFRLPFGQAEPPAIIMDYDRNVIRIVESRGGTIERSIVEIPLRRSELPDQLGKIVPVLVVAGAAAFGREIILIPPLQFGFWRQRHLAGLLAADQIAAHRDHRLAALRPQRRDDVGRARAPIETGDGRLLDFESIHQGDDIGSDHRLLAVTDGFGRKKTRRAVAAQIRHDHPVALRRQQRRDIDKAVNVVRPAVQKDDGAAVRRTGLGVSDIQDAGIDLLERCERRMRPRFGHAQCHRFGLAGLRSRGIAHGEPGRGNGHGRGAKKAAAIIVDVLDIRIFSILNLCGLMDWSRRKWTARRTCAPYASAHLAQ